MGYNKLEMEVLGYLGHPAPAHELEVPLRLLAADKETVAKERAHRASVNATQIRHLQLADPSTTFSIFS